jgi:hypothetical protein
MGGEKDLISMKGGVIMADATSIPVASEPAYLEVTLGRAIRVWWALFWRGLLYCGLAGLLIGFVEGLIGFGRPQITMPSGFLVGLPVGVYVVRAALRKQYRHFSIRLVASPH